jgi:hypothetical protein
VQQLTQQIREQAEVMRRRVLEARS